MILKTLWIQRICSYDGEYAPECIVCVDEFSYDDYSDWFDDECKKELNKVKEDIISHKIIDIEVNQDRICELLNDTPIIKGEIK